MGGKHSLQGGARPNVFVCEHDVLRLYYAEGKDRLLRSDQSLFALRPRC